MARKRITEIFPFLIPIRVWERKRFYYLKMFLDKNKYAKQRRQELLPYKIITEKTKMINEESGYDIVYQENKVHNLRVLSQTMNHICIRPNETFSFCYLARKAKKYGKYKEGLVLINENIVPKKGGGICQLSSLLYYAFLKTPLTIVERHGHKVKKIPNSDKDSLEGIDATIHSGWLDLKVRNDTEDTYQIIITFDQTFMYITIACSKKYPFKIKIKNENLQYIKKGEKTYESVDVVKEIANLKEKKIEKKILYKEMVEIQYNLPNKKGEK